MEAHLLVIYIYWIWLMHGGCNTLKHIKLFHEMCSATVASLSFQNECLPSVNKYEVS